MLGERVKVRELAYSLLAIVYATPQRHFILFLRSLENEKGEGCFPKRSLCYHDRIKELTVHADQ